MFVQITHQHVCVKSGQQSRGSRLTAAYFEHDCFHSLTSVKNTTILLLTLAETRWAAALLTRCHTVIQLHTLEPESCAVHPQPLSVGHWKLMHFRQDHGKTHFVMAEALSSILFRQCDSCFRGHPSFLAPRFTQWSCHLNTKSILQLFCYSV